MCWIVPKVGKELLPYAASHLKRAHAELISCAAEALEILKHAFFSALIVSHQHQYTSLGLRFV